MSPGLLIRQFTWTDHQQATDIPTFPKHELHVQEPFLVVPFLESRVHLQLQLKPGFHNDHLNLPSHLRIRVMISGTAFDCSDHLSHQRIFPCDHFKSYTIIKIICIELSSIQMIEVIPLSRSFAVVQVVFSYNCSKLVNIIILRWLGRSERMKTRQ